MSLDLAPDDERFVALLYRTFSSPEFEGIISGAAEARPFEQAFAEWVEAGVWEEGDVEAAEALYLENASSRGFFRGQFAEAVRELALLFTGEDEESLRRIPLLMMPSGELNARVFSAPSGLPVVVLNQGLIAQMAFIINATLSFISWHDEDPFCKDVPQSDYGAALVGLAFAVVSGDLRHLKPHAEALRFRSLGDYNKQTDMWLQLTEAFIVLHEFGHVIRGHLDPLREHPAEASVVTGAATAEQLESFEYNRSQLDEFEADAYSFDRILATGKGGFRSTDVALVAGISLRFLVLCERLSGASSDTHPPAVSRWERIKDLAGLDENPRALAHRLDGGFDTIEAHLFRDESDPASA